jgi:hypothetical protein
MKISNDSLITASVDLSSSSNLMAYYIGHVGLAAVQLVYTGTPAGNFKIQGSCDRGQPNASSESQQAVGVTNWSDVSSATTISAAGSLIINLPDPGYQWIRVAWTATGAGTTPFLTVARATTKGF